MKKKFILALSLLSMALMVYNYNFQQAYTNSSQSPQGNSGSPADGQTCGTSCHSGGPAQSNETVSLTSNIPASGYVGGTTYQFTITMTKAGGQRFGFQLSPQEPTGALVGELIAGSGTAISGGKYLSHANSSDGTDSKAWNFEWTAPVSGSGSVTFYGAFNFANNNVAPSGDVIVAESFVINETNVGISETELAAILVYPNPVIDEIHVAAKDVDEEILITLFDIEGRKVLVEKHDGGDIRVDLSSKSLNTGVYFLQIEVGGRSTVKKLLVK